VRTDHLNGDDREKKVFYELGRAEPTYTVDTAHGGGSSAATVSSVLGHLDGLPPPPYVGRDVIMTSGLQLHGIPYQTSGSISPGPASAAASFIQMAGAGGSGGSGAASMPYYMSHMGMQQQQQQQQQQHQHLSTSSPFGHPLQYGGGGLSSGGGGHLSLEHSIPPPPPPGIAMPGLQSISSGLGGYGVADQASANRNSASGYWYNPPNTTDSRFSSEFSSFVVVHLGLASVV